ncbi:WavE lipopolysaccharide synthesis family protein [Ensifer sp. SL37]|uniref:WavE lipopolysaccharide synthesis family protein n=1 Tax=Ensifer sp. SL37 TaxID=2995137 RepID=UPI002274D4A4|nr:WavE lipopolysaccharide synthesis family protein [Ensifer sp. SL37]MCY1740371.1 hypothetical protein [Ensifer sp. SL37]
MAIDEHLSVIVQGPVSDFESPLTGRPMTESLCRSVRNYLPRAEIVVSTWEGADTEKLDYDTLVTSEDPGPQGVRPGFIPNNINRQIVSTKRGLQAAGRKYAVKIRSDMELLGGEFLECLPNMPVVRTDDAIFERVMLCNNLSSRHPSAVSARLPGHWLLFHPSDHFHAGLRNDLLSLWEIPLQSREDANWFLSRFRPNSYRDNELSKLTPEQYMFTQALARTRSIDLAHYAHAPPDLLNMSQRMMRAHFFHVSDRRLPILFPKYHTPHHFSFDWMRVDDVCRNNRIPFSLWPKALFRDGEPN